MLGTALALALALVISMGIASGGETAPQAPLPSSETTPLPLPEVTPLAALVVASPSRTGITEVRLPIVVTNSTDRMVPADLTAFDELQFAVVDAAGTVHTLDWRRPQRAAMPNHSVRFLEPSMAARWTLGFQVPTAAADDLRFEVRVGTVTHSWQFGNLGGMGPTNGLADIAGTVALLDERFTWQPDVTAMATGVGSLLCGDPMIEAVTHVVGVTFDVENDTASDLIWPAAFDVEGMPVAQWADGTSADMSREAPLPGSPDLPSVSSFAVRIPPRTATSQVMYFASPRDGRFTDPTALPLGVLVNPGGSSTWISLAGAAATVPMSDDLCDLGFLGGPVPFGHTPRVQFEVTADTDPLEPVPPGPEEPNPGTADDESRAAIAEALAAAATFYDDADGSFDTVSETSLTGYATNVEFVGRQVGAATPTVQGVMYFDVLSGNQFIYLVTQSASGRWFCAGLVPHGPVVAYDGDSLHDIEPICLREKSLIGN